MTHAFPNYVNKLASIIQNTKIIFERLGRVEIEKTEVINLLNEIRNLEWPQGEFEYALDAKQYVEEFRALECIVDCYFLEPLDKLKAILPSLGLIRTQFAKLDSVSLRIFKQTLLPIPRTVNVKPSQAKLGHKQNNPVRKAVKKKSNKRDRRGSPSEQVSFKEKEGIGTKKTQSIPKSLNATNRPVEFFKCVSEQLYHHSSSNISKSCLIQAAWHLEKLNTVRGLLKSDDLNPADYLNMVTALTTHASHALEQMLNFHILENNPDYNVKIHNLKILHAKLTNQKACDSIKRFYLGSYWARYPLEEFDDWRKSITHDRSEIPKLLENIAVFATQSEQLSIEEFRSYCHEILDTLETDISQLIPDNDYKAIENISPALKQETYFQPEELHALLSKNLLCQKNLFGHGLHKLQESKLCIEMLQRTLLKLNEASTVEKFTFWSTRALYLMQESTDHLLHSLEFFREKPITTHHDILRIEININLEPSEFGSDMQRLGRKLKYPYSTPNEGIATSLVDSITSLGLHPDLEENFQLKSSSVATWELPLKDVSSNGIALTLNQMLGKWQEYTLKLLELYQTTS